MFDYLSVKKLLDKKYLQYNNPDFISTDPIQLPHRFSKKEDIEISAFLIATIAWGQRISIIKNGNSLAALMDNSPYEFVTTCSEKDLARFNYFTHRTFQGEDCVCFLRALKNIYLNEGGLESVFTKGFQSTGSIYGTLTHFRTTFLTIPHRTRSRKHIANVAANASAKRLNMFLRWMVRADGFGVDFGIWKNIPMSALMLPLDLHTGNVARELGILRRKQNDWKAVEEITTILRTFDPADLAKYDFALFGMGAIKTGA